MSARAGSVASMSESTPGQELAPESDQHRIPPETSSSGSGADAGEGGATSDGEAGELGPQPLGVAVVPTGHAEVDTGLRRLADVDHLMVSAHPEVYEDVHRGFRATLSALDQPAAPPPSRSYDLRS